MGALLELGLWMLIVLLLGILLVSDAHRVVRVQRLRSLISDHVDEFLIPQKFTLKRWLHH